MWSINARLRNPVAVDVGNAPSPQPGRAKDNSPAIHRWVSSLDILGGGHISSVGDFVENFVGTTIRPSKAAQHRRDSSQESPSERQIRASRRTLLLAKVKIGSALDCRCGCHIKKSTMVQFRVPAIAFRNIQQRRSLRLCRSADKSDHTVPRRRARS